MKYLTRLLAIAIGSAFIFTSIAWMKGNEVVRTYEVEQDVSPFEVEEPEAGKQYYRKSTVVETKFPSTVPLIWNSKIDTVDTGIYSKSL